MSNSNKWCQCWCTSQTVAGSWGAFSATLRAHSALERINKTRLRFSTAIQGISCFLPRSLWLVTQSRTSVKIHPHLSSLLAFLFHILSHCLCTDHHSAGHLVLCHTLHKVALWDFIVGNGVWSCTWQKHRSKFHTKTPQLLDCSFDWWSHSSSFVILHLPWQHQKEVALHWRREMRSDGASCFAKNAKLQFSGMLGC